MANMIMTMCGGIMDTSYSTIQTGFGTYQHLNRTGIRQVCFWRDKAKKFKGNSKHRDIDTDRWAYEDPATEIVYEWEFATKKWAFQYGNEKEAKPLLLKTRKSKPEANGHHHHVDYSIFYYSTATKDNAIEEFDISQCYFGKHHRLVQCKFLAPCVWYCLTYVTWLMLNYRLLSQNYTVRNFYQYLIICFTSGSRNF